MKVKCRVKC